MRAELLKRGLLDSNDVLDEIRAIPQAQSRAVLAVAAAHYLARRRLESGKADDLDRQCVKGVDSMWRLLSANTLRSAITLPWRLRLWKLIHRFGEAADREHVAATIYAADALESGSADAAGWAVSCVIDDAWAALRPSTGIFTLSDDDVLEHFASPEMQTVLGRFSSTARLLRNEGFSADMVERVRARITG